MKTLERIKNLNKNDFYLDYNDDLFYNVRWGYLNSFEYLGEEIDRVNDEIEKKYPNSFKIYDVDAVKWGGTSTIDKSLRTIPLYINEDYFVAYKNRNTLEYVKDEIERFYDTEFDDFIEQKGISVEDVTFEEGDNKISFREYNYEAYLEGDFEVIKKIFSDLGVKIHKLPEDYDMQEDYMIVLDDNYNTLSYNEVYNECLIECFFKQNEAYYSKDDIISRLENIREYSYSENKKFVKAVYNLFN